MRPVLILGIILLEWSSAPPPSTSRGAEALGIDWSLALVAGLVGSFVGGLLFSLLAGDGLDLGPSGLIGSFVGAVIVTVGWKWWQSCSNAAATPARRR